MQTILQRNLENFLVEKNCGSRLDVLKSQTDVDYKMPSNWKLCCLDVSFHVKKNSETLQIHMPFCTYPTQLREKSQNYTVCFNNNFLGNPASGI